MGKHRYNDPELGVIEITIPDNFVDSINPRVGFMWWLKKQGEHEAYNYVFHQSILEKKFEIEELIEFYLKFKTVQANVNARFESDFNS